MVLREESPKDSAAPHPFDLEERTAQFGEAIVRFSKQIPRDPTNNRLIDQLVGCGTSVGANYCEANEAVSKKDFRNTAGRCMKEAKESRFFLRMVVASEPQLAEEARELYREAKELLLILGSMQKEMKLQNQSSKLQTNTNRQAPNARATRWSLVLALDFGALERNFYEAQIPSSSSKTQHQAPNAGGG
jgi:four helix bundle protein